MELSQIRYFLDAAQTQHITKSANNLHIAQPALTKSIHNLEKELNVPLFYRKGRNVALTPYGEHLRDRLLPLINALDSLSAEFSSITDTENHTIRLSVLAASTIVTQAIIEHKKDYPEINFHVLQNPEDEVFDIEITTNLFFNNSDSDNVFVCSEDIFLAVPNTEKYKDITSIDLFSVKDEGFISLFGSKQLRSICDRFCLHAGFEPNIIFESDSPYAVKNMIAANLGVGFWPQFTWGNIDTDNVKLLKISNPICKRDIIITYKAMKTDNTHTERFYKFLRNYITDKKSSNSTL